MAPITSIKVRMYRQGFGDCFLLQFMNGNKRTSSMLIDCGLKAGSKANKPLKEVVEDIATVLTPPGKKKPELDVLVVTHEHWDHVSGFNSQKKLFEEFNIGQVWMAWTEDPDDDVAKQINKRLKKNQSALHFVNEKIKKNNLDKADFYKQYLNGDNYLKMRESFSESLNSLMQFSNMSAKQVEVETPSGIKIKKYEVSLGTEEAMGIAKSLSGNAVKYFSPGKTITDSKMFPALRMYVLGPPKTAKLNKDLPSKGAAKETYFSMSDSSLDGFVSGVLAANNANGHGLEDGAPFTDVTTVKDSAPEAKKLYETYYHENEQWRMIDDDWLDIGGALALQMDEDTNNTSLVLAIEFTGSGKVLLFPGDAQVGSWESWHDVNFEFEHDNKKKNVTAENLLHNTVFYKVSHHASHNATLKSKGLELMESEDLVAFIPEMNDSYSGIPHPALVDKLRIKTNGRMIFSADKNFPIKNFKATKPSGQTKTEWNDFTSRLDINDLFVEYEVNA